MRPGLCGYNEGSHKETVFLANDTLAAMAKTCYGIPVIIRHQDVNTSNVNDVVVGRVADMHQEGENWTAHFVVDTQEAVDLLSRGWGVSTTYEILKSGPGGTLNNVPYDREIQDAKYLSLAIVENPRYEMAKNPIFYNSKNDLPTVGDESNISNINQSEGKSMLGKLWRFVKNEVSGDEVGQCLVMVNGVKKSMSDLTTELHQLENSKETLLNDTDEVEYAGQKITVGELVKRYENAKSKKNAEEVKEVKEEKEEEKEEEKKNEEKEEKEEEKKNEKENFDALKTIKENSVAIPAIDDSMFQTIREKTDAGRKAYGSVK
jgi:hypothetical protein